MPIAVQSYTIRYNVFDRKQVESAYKRFNEMGYDGLENGLGRQFGYSVEEELELLAKYNLRVCDVGGDYTKPDEAMKLAEKYGTKYLFGPHMTGPMMITADGVNAFIEQLNEAARPFAGTGYKLLYHNHAQEFRNFTLLNGKSGYEILVEGADPEVVCFQVDTFWTAASGADPAYWIKRLKGRVPVVHFKDYAIDDQVQFPEIPQIPWRFAEIGQGNINWAAVSEACREAGVEWYSVEQDYVRGDGFGCLKTSIDYMRNTLNIV